MIQSDQPTIFPPGVVVRVSSTIDGTMTLRSLPENPEAVWDNRKKFIHTSGGEIEKTALVYVTYDDGDDFCRYREVAVDEYGIKTNLPCDALVTQTPGVGLFLPLADCCGLVLYDPDSKTLMLSHVGRHSCVQYGAKKSVEYLAGAYDVAPGNLLVWLSPAVGIENYPIYARNNKSLKSLIVEDLVAAGVAANNIAVSPIDTDKSPQYFSHSEYRKGNRGSLNGRFAVFAMMNK